MRKVLVTLMGVVCLAGLWAGTACAEAQEDALVFRASFDSGVRPEVGPAEAKASQTKAAPGRLGQAVRVPVGAKLAYDMAGRMDGRKGTFSCWIQAGEEIAGAKLPAGRILHVASREEGYYYTFLRLSQKRAGGAAGFETFGATEYEDASAHGATMERVATWKPGEWHHLAFAWHCRKGVRFYHDGQLAFSSWGRDEWTPTTPTQLFLNSHPATAAQIPFLFDEVRVYAEALSDEQVAMLARGEDVRASRVAEQFAPRANAQDADRLRKELEPVASLPLVTYGPAYAIRQLLPRGMKTRKVSTREVADGVLRSIVTLAAPLDLSFAGEQAFNAVEVDGPAPAVALEAATLRQSVAAAGRVGRAQLPEAKAAAVRLSPTGGGCRVAEVRLLHIAPSAEEPAGIRCPLRRIALPADAPSAGSSWPESSPAAGALYALSPDVLEAVPGGQAGGEAVTGPRVDIVTAPLAEDTGISALRLELKLDAPLPRLARIRLTETQESLRSLFQVDLRLGAPDGKPADTPATLRLHLDWPDTIIPKGQRVWAALLFDSAVRVLPGSEATLVTCPLADAREEYVARQLAWFASWYSVEAEAHRWDSATYQPDPQIRWLENVRRYDPGNPLALAYHNRIFHHSREVNPPIPGPAKAPLWARAQREALRRTSEIIHWWIDNRQTEDGQFGGHWNDDVEMLHNWDLVPLATGDRSVTEAMARLCDGLWNSGRFTRGYSNCIWDVEHAAEESSYSQPRMVLLDYGSPRWIERCMETISNFDFWTAVNAKGHRHFRSYMFQAQKILNQAETDSDVRDNARAMKPGNLVAWYNGQPKVVQWFREWADAWCADALRTDDGKPAGILPAEILFADCRLGREGSRWDRVKHYDLGAIVYHMEDELAATAMLTGDRKYLDPIQAMARQGQAGELAQANWRLLTGAKDLDERFIAKAKGAGLTCYLAWLATGDRKHLDDACVEAVRDLERSRFLVTEAEPPTDRVPIPGNLLLRHMLLGGSAVHWAGYPFLAVSWEKTGADFAALVLPPARPPIEGPGRRLRVLAYNFGPEREIVLRPWQLARGEYDLAVGVDGNSDDRPDRPGKTRRVSVERGGRVPLRLAGDALSVIELSLVKAAPTGPLPDLGIGPGDAKPSPDGRQLTVTVHSLGAVDARPVAVVLRDGAGKVIGQGSCPALEAPLDLRARTVEVAIPVPAGVAPSQVEIDPQRAQEEITRENNRLAITRQ